MSLHSNVGGSPVYARKGFSSGTALPDLGPDVRITYLSDEAPVASFFSRFRDPVNSLTSNWNSVMADDPIVMDVVGEASLLFVQRATSVRAKFIIEMVKALGIPVVYDAEDALPSLYTKARPIVESADVVLCSNHTAARRLLAQGPAVVVLENYSVPAPWERIVRSRLRKEAHIGIITGDEPCSEDLLHAVRSAVTNLKYRITFNGRSVNWSEQVRAEFPEAVRIDPYYRPNRQFAVERLSAEGVNLALLTTAAMRQYCSADDAFLQFGASAIPVIFETGFRTSRVQHRGSGFVCDGSYESLLEALEFFAVEQNCHGCGDRAYAECSQRTLNDYASEFAGVVEECIARRNARPGVLTSASKASAMTAVIR